ncbi:P-loop containing nucleoside triphosphate hydrolase protein [Apiosordaria backusii]|uniref:P-loop containing nucleoside triphosphate hydrolase protein n=1 Tax=Apiosordaria backusii TaxID=314023 RepID=A0AA40BEI0_9PEZI|nr:P-loop containing nucleoside triphosphate hydrolase protein [Apiosordaria backusii]
MAVDQYSEKSEPTRAVSPSTPEKKESRDASPSADLKKLDSKGGQDPSGSGLYPDVKVGVATLYRYSSRNDIIILIVSAICAIASGAALPLMTVVFGNLQGTFQNYFTPGSNVSYDEFTSELGSLCLYFVYLAIGEFVTSYIATVGFIYCGEHISAKIREHYLESCMKQNIGFFDKLGAGEVTTRITADTNLIQEGISEKVGLTLQAVSTFIAAFVIGFVSYWKLTLILMSTVVALLLVMGTGSRFIVKYSRQNISAYAQGGSVAEEVISSVRNAVAFGTQDRLAKQYDVHLIKAEFFGFKVKSILGVMVAGMMLILYLNYGLAFWMGSVFLLDGSTSLSKILIVMMAVMMGAFNLGNVAPNMQAFTTALGAAAKIYSTIDRQSPIDPSTDDGIKLEKVEGTIRLKGIKHIYPSRPEVVVMDDVNLTIPAGKVTALVGASGSGKSTIVGLVERFYAPIEGTVYLDGVDISALNLRWLRQQIALVSQEPTLFGTTIYENIRHGLIGTKWENESPERQRELIEEAAKKANAHDFISSLPEGYETNVGERGFLLSGGQKQRIAIARAIVSDPKILLLDEATSALDTKSEGVVQAALEVASEGRTTITIAHRLSTIKDAHNIVVMSQGRIVEQGTHDELLEKRGSYYNLVTAQAIAAVNEMTAEEEEAINEEEKAALIRKASKKQEGVPEDPDDDINAKLNRSTSTKSVSSMALAGREKPTAKKYSLWTLIRLIASFNKKEWKLMLIGLFFSAICGLGNPTQAVFFAKLITALSLPPTTQEIRDHMKSEASFWCLMYLMLAIVMFIAFTAQGIVFAKCSERLIHRVRDRSFRTMLRQDVEYFDTDEHSAGALTSFLSTETTHVAGLSGSTLGTLIMVTSTLVAACTVALAIGWKLALVCIATMPLLIGCGFFRFWMLAHYQRRAKRAYQGSASFASEAITAIRTVASLTREEDVLRNYRESLAIQQRASLKSVLKSSLLYAGSQSLMFLAFALGFWYGGTLIAKYEYDMFQFFLVFTSVIFGAQSAGSVFSFAPDMGKAAEASRNLKTLFDMKPLIDTWSEDGDKVEAIEGSLEFRDVHFRYPTRPEQPVLRGLNLTISPGQYVALVGASGCGKSTTIALLERFYDPLAGGIFVDGKEISSLNINEYRSFIALVSQEPTLYQGTIKENILLGAPYEVSDEQIKFACQEANIYDFILSLPEGFNTMVGSKGALLSGGQKQRIAIARALVRDPKILLLDEATSALDSESEHVVQAALDKAAKGRTTIAVAHRLSTIQKADIIYVFDQGRIVEKGTHSELMKANGRYAELVNLQSLEKNR